ncbi:MAG TPA: DUF4397 domain-containing protein [Gemmatimonas aurantiaca]|uniref:DUF4397 domain-containing protein n=3 Tax=Gemmatimonas aurantiaca TaxID=173480 RepID=C1ACL1_GEMAT|nr:hypothetical protein GAU_3196 [Gemmatimonas aurantiaca T-27]HCT57752.1 DUF4397 domain-containing protein [Gemmatimonas aurantiaca]
MNAMTINRIFSRSLRSVTLLGAVVLAACDKTAVQTIDGPLPTARIRFYNFGLNAPGMNFYANTDKVTAISSATGVESTTGIVYGGVGLGSLYSALAPGQYTFTGRIAATVDKDVAVATIPGALADGKAYSLFVSGFYNTTAKTVEGFIVEDVLPPEPLEVGRFLVTHVRFVNAIPNSSPMTLYARNTTTGTEVAIGGAIAYKSAGAFVEIPAGTYDLNTRVAGSTTNVISRAATGFAGGRVYTIGGRGDMTITSTTATNRPFLDNTTNR